MEQANLDSIHPGVVTVHRDAVAALLPSLPCTSTAGCISSGRLELLTLACGAG